MKIEFAENDGCFHFSMRAENMADAALLVRFGMNATKEIRHLSASVNADGTFMGGLVLGKHAKADNYVPRRK